MLLLTLWHCFYLYSYLALVCLLRAENFMKQGIIDYNIDCFKSAIGDVFKVPEKNRIVN